jgi:hypothetical protein
MYLLDIVARKFIISQFIKTWFLCRLEWWHIAVTFVGGGVCVGVVVP